MKITAVHIKNFSAKNFSNFVRLTLLNGVCRRAEKYIESEKTPHILSVKPGSR